MEQKKINLTRGLSVIEIAELGTDGTPKNEWRAIGYCDRDNPVTYTEADPTKTEYRVHETSTPVEVDYEEGSKNLEMFLIGPTKEQLALLVQGTITGTGDDAEISIPADRRPIERAVRIIPKQGDVNIMYRVLLTAMKNGNWEVSGKNTYKVTGDVLMPLNSALPVRKEGPKVTKIRGGIATLTILNGGSGYTNGTHTVDIDNQAGSGAKASVTVADGEVTAITVTSPGRNYHVGSVVTVTGLSGGAGFEAVIDTVA